MRFRSMPVILSALLAGCVGSGVSISKDSFTGQTTKTAMIRLAPDYARVVILYFSRPLNSDSKNVALTVFVNTPSKNFQFRSENALGIKSDGEISWLIRKPGAVDRFDTSGVYAEFQPIEIDLVRTIAKGKNVEIQANEVGSSMTIPFMPADVAVLKEFAN